MYSSITSVASAFPKGKAAFTFEGALPTYVSSSSDEESSRTSLGNTDNKSDSPAANDEQSYEYSSSEKSKDRVSLTTDDDSSYDSSSFGDSRNNHTPEVKEEGNRMENQDLGIPPTVFSSDDLDLLLKSFSVDDGPNVPGNPFSSDEQDEDVPGNPFSGDDEDIHRDVPGNPFSGDEEDSPSNPFSKSNTSSESDVHFVLSSQGKAMIQI